MAEEIRCEVCGKSFKTRQALAGHRQGACGSDAPGTAASTPQPSKSLTRSSAGALDSAIERLQVPAVPQAYNGAAQAYWEGFNRGVAYGANTILVGIRSAQELSALGIAQATPLIKMAQEMRQAEGQAAEIIAAEMAQATLHGNQQLMDAIHNLAKSHQAPVPNPMMEVVAETMKPFLQQTLQALMGGMLKGFQGQTSAVPVQGAEGAAPGQPALQPEQRNPVEGGGQQDSWGELPSNVQPMREEDFDV